MRKIVIVNESQFKRMVKRVLKEQNFPPIKGVTTDNTSVKNIPGRNYAVGNEEEANFAVKGMSRKEMEDLGIAVAATAAAFIPWIGWAVSAAILGYDAYNKFQEGKFRQGGISSLFAILSVAIPALRLYKGLSVLSSLGEPGIIALGNALKGGQKLTKIQINALIELLTQPEAIAKAIEKLSIAKNIPIAQPVSKFTSAVQKFKSDWLPYIVTKVGYESGAEIGNKLFAPTSK